MDLRYPDPGHKSCGRADDELGGRGHHTNQWLLVAIATIPKN